MKDIQSRIISAIQMSGIMLDAEYEEDVDLTELIEDSYQFINMIINLEEQLGIEIPDDYLVVDKFKSLNGFIAMIGELAA